MARVTVEDCLEQVENRFALVLIAAQRTRQILKGAPSLLESQRDNKEAVIALREIAEGLVPYEIEESSSQEELEEAIAEMQTEPEDVADDLVSTEQLFSKLDQLTAASNAFAAEAPKPTPAAKPTAASASKSKG